MYRMANSLALLDAHVRKVGPDRALGSRGFDNYSWHTDLPPGHPMVTGQQTVEFDLATPLMAGAVSVRFEARPVRRSGRTVFSDLFGVRPGDVVEWSIPAQ